MSPTATPHVVIARKMTVVETDTSGSAVRDVTSDPTKSIVGTRNMRNCTASTGFMEKTPSFTSRRFKMIVTLFWKLCVPRRPGRQDVVALLAIMAGSCPAWVARWCWDGGKTVPRYGWYPPEEGEVLAKRRCAELVEKHHRNRRGGEQGEPQASLPHLHPGRAA